MDSDRDEWEFLQAKIIALGVRKSGSFKKLSNDIPISQSHLQLLKSGDGLMGGIVLTRFLKHVGVIDTMHEIIDQKLGESKN